MTRSHLGQTTLRSTRVRKPPRWRTVKTGRVRLCTRPRHACAFPDTGPAVSRRTCPFVHTGRPRVCKVGHGTGRIAPHLSVCAHAALWRVQSRTRDLPNGAALVRLRTPSNAPCAQADTTTGKVPGRLRVRGLTCRRAPTVDHSYFFKQIRAASAAVSLRG